MKNLFNNGVAILLFILIVSCENGYNDIQNDARITNNSSLLLKEIASFNDSLINSKEICSTRAIDPEMKKRAYLIGADFVGAISLARAGFWAGSLLGPQAAGAGGTIGALVGGVCGSFVAYHELYVNTRSGHNAVLIPSPNEVVAAYTPILKSDIQINDFTPKNINLNIPLQYESARLMGARHNLIMDNLLANNIDTQSIHNYLTEDEEAVINSSEYVTQYNSAMSAIALTQTEQLFEGDDMPSMVMNLFYEVFMSYPDDCTDIQHIINRYVEAIENSIELSEQEKSFVYSSLSVAASSYEYWTNLINN